MEGPVLTTVSVFTASPSFDFVWADKVGGWIDKYMYGIDMLLLHNQLCLSYRWQLGILWRMPLQWHLCLFDSLGVVFFCFVNSIKYKIIAYLDVIFETNILLTKTIVQLLYFCCAFMYVICRSTSFVSFSCIDRAIAKIVLTVLLILLMLFPIEGT